MREGEEDRMEGLGEEVRKEGGERRGREGEKGEEGEEERWRGEGRRRKRRRRLQRSSVRVETMRGDDNK